MVREVVNRSSRHPTKKVHALIRFVCRRTRHHRKTTIRLQDQKTDGLTTGYATVQPKPEIILTLSKGVSHYPRRTRHVREVGTVVLQNWQEEVLLVLAHELAHIDDFVETRFKSGQEHAAEVRAETFAVAVLNEFRAR